MKKKNRGRLQLIRIGSFFEASLLTLFLCLSVSAAEVDVQATVDRNVINLGEALTLQVAVSTSDTSSIGEPRLPGLEGFSLQNRSTQTESRSVFNNGSFQFLRTQRFLYVLNPEREGKLKIGQVEVNVGDKTYNTQPITIDVKAAGAGGVPRPLKKQPQFKQQTQQGDDGSNGPDVTDPMDEADELFNQLLQRRGVPPPSAGPQAPINPNEAFFIQAEIDKDKVYEGEQVTASWYLYTRNAIRDIDTLKYPTLTGFWKEDIEVATNLNFQNEVINGIPYRKALLASYALFPIKAGTSNVDPYKAKCTVLIQQGSTFFTVPQPYVFTKASLPLKVTVLPLPADRPKSFSGAVGQFKARVTTDKNVVPVNEPFSLKIRFEGRGNAKLINLPSLNLPDKFEQFDSKNESKFMTNGTSYKEFEVILVPRVKGEAVIPSFEFSYFDPQKKQYITSASDPIKINIAEGKAGEGIQSQRLKSPETKQESSSKDLPGVVYKDDYLSSITKYRFMIWGFVFVAALIFIGFRTFQELGIGEKQKTLTNILSDRFAQVHSLASKKEWRKAGAQTVNAVYQILGEMGGAGGGNDSLEQLISKVPPSVKREIENKLISHLVYFEKLAFAPESEIIELQDVKILDTKIKELKKLLQKSISVFEEKRE